MNHTLRRGIAASVLSTGALVGLSGAVAFAAPTGATGKSTSFITAQQKLEAQLANRVTSLGHLATDVSGSTTLTANHRAVLSARISTEQASINALVAKVPTDTSNAQLNADRSAMLKDNRVYAVMTPQVFETISADAAGATLTSLAAEEPTLASEVASIGVGNPGYTNAASHDANFVKRVANQTTVLSNLVTSVLAQAPANYPGDQHFFARANLTIRDADVAIAYANYDASVIALATGGYTGS